MTLFDELLYELDGEAAATSDAATARLEAVLARFHRSDPAERGRVVAQVTRLHDEAELDALTANARHDTALAQVSEWEDRAARSSGQLRAEAEERIEQARAKAAGIAEEVAEYRTTVERLAEVRALIASTGG